MNWPGSCKSLSIVCFLLIICLSPALAADSDFVVLVNTSTAADVPLTSDQMSNAQPMPRPPINSLPVNGIRGVDRPSPAGPKNSDPGEPPANNLSASALSSILSAATSLVGSQSPHTQIDSVGLAGLDYTSTQLIPTVADVFYPYSAVGKLFVALQPGGPFTVSCSASVIRTRVIVTAGHCVADGKGHFFGAWKFVPAYHNGQKPFGEWLWSAVVVTNTWFNGGGGTPNAADYAVITLQTPNQGDVGNVVGRLGFATLSLSPNDVTMLGYPCNIDNGVLMHENYSGQSNFFVAQNVGQYGGDMTEGSSGGPFVQDFGNAGAGQLQGGNNYVVGVISFGTDVNKDPDGCTRKLVFFDQFASEFDIRFTNILTQACNLRAGNCP